MHPRKGAKFVVCENGSEYSINYILEFVNTFFTRYCIFFKKIGTISCGLLEIVSMRYSAENIKFRECRCAVYTF